jgi:signal transduction histidine kinase/CheY-like chemotaxis protein/HPt (histidine-containing phosphotransfer) domain-containing protein
MRLSRISKLVGTLLIGTTLTLVAVWQQALTHLAIGGTTYSAISEAKDLVADILPPPQYVIEPFLLATLALNAPATAPQRHAQSLKMKTEYDERHAHWNKSGIDSQIRDLLLEQAHQPALVFWNKLFDEFYPALNSGDRSKATKVYEALSEHYVKHRTAIDKLVVKANGLVATAETNSNQKRSYVTLLTAAISSFSFLFVCACVWALCSYYSGPIEQMRKTMVELSNGNFDVAVPFTTRNDEIGDMARTLLVFSAAGRRKRELALQNQALNDKLIERTTVLEETLDKMAQGIILVRDGSLVLCNQNARTLLEVETEEAVCETLYVAMGGSDDATLTEERRTLPVGQTRKDLTCASGRFVEIRLSKGSTAGDIYTVSDVSMLKRRQAELEAALATAGAAIEARSRFFSTMSHEMRTPLNGIIGSLELLRRQDLNQDQIALVEVGLQSSDALLAQINDVLDFSKMEAGKLELNTAQTGLVDVVKSSIAVMAPIATHKQTNLSHEIIGEVPGIVLADGNRIRQVLLNFMSNALKFTTSGTVKVWVRRTGGTDEVPQIEFAVVDTGPGIPRERLPMLFQEFSMAHAATTETSGTGLGLAISKRLVDAMGGSVGVESVEGLGSSFWFRIMLPALTAVTSTCHAKENTTTEETTHLKILLVDDNHTNRLIGLRLLEKDGHEVETAKNGLEAVEAAARDSFDVILMDISMPKMDGIEATRQIRQLKEPHSSVKIIALTANAVRGDRERFLGAGMDDYITKPLRPAEIQARLKAIGIAKSQSVPVCDAVPNAPDHPLLDPDTLDGLGAHEPAVIVEVLDIYCEELDRKICEFEIALRSSDGQALKQVAHAIAGASASTGATLLAAKSREIEHTIMEGRMEEAFSLARAIPDLVRRTQRVCRTRCGSNPLLNSARTLAA